MRLQVLYIFILSVFITSFSYAQSYILYDISFNNAMQHEAEVKVSFTKIKKGTFSFRMSRSSPGRYAIHEFAKNVYNVKATDSKGNELLLTRPNPYAWEVAKHDGTVNVTYTLFANRGDGTYAQIDETHAHLNIPATFMYAPSLKDTPIQITFNPRKDWKIATQLKKMFNNTYYAPNLQYFMDSPTELSNHFVRSFEVESSGETYKINLALHTIGTEAEADAYFEKVKKIVLQQKAVFGELPKFDFGEYTFLACYIPNTSGDGMEHRNSTILTSTRTLANGGMTRNIGTVSHEFFHAWNVERIRPKSLEPFNFEKANMSGELWFAEGFTSYYTNLILTRAGLMSPENYINSLNGTFNYVWNSTGRSFFNPIEMSYQAPFVDAATSVDPVNRGNTFISYYSYGSVLGLALDLALRNEKGNLSLDGYMQLVWNTYGKNEKPYTIDNLHKTLNKYAGKLFGDYFFNHFIYKSAMPNYEPLFKNMGIVLKRDSKNVYFGVSTSSDGLVRTNAQIGTPAYKAGLNVGDKIVAIDQHVVSATNSVSKVLSNYKIGATITIQFSRYNQLRTAKVTLIKDPRYTIQSFEKAGLEITPEIEKNRKAWLGEK
ncbi:MAG: M61 family metallopeptidase [Flavobacteriaceae bacterium]|nr:M61 family metallopeptidase [Flavobacteriaceae bacterium]